mgnify:CR=1 FL=1
MTEPLTQHYRLADGVLAERTVSGTDLPELPDGATPLTPEQYTAALAEVHALREEHRARLAAEDQERMRNDYDALTALGVPVSTASRLTGYTPEEGQ